ncbi:MAG: sigma 54-interacting transcriptional regulator [Deltaproteobacteria bacterium]|nr:sigma 54-interacting transcriptional regulator [Deltaproteobacteria bacterium]
MAELFIHRGKTPLLRLPIDRDRLLLGSGSDCHLVLPREAAPRQQAELRFGDEGWSLHNLTPEGTRLDARTVQESAPLTDGAVIGLASDWTVVFRLGEATSPGETRRRAGSGKTRALPDPLPRSQAGELVLRWRRGDESGSRPLGEGPLTLGSDEGNDLVLPDPFASAFHARLLCREGGWWLEDLDSTNGTTVGGLPVERIGLEPGAVVRIGETELFLERPEDRALAGRWGILTRHPALEQVLDQVERVAASEATVTIFGESGSGKELIARAVHLASPRGEGPYIPVNCAAISKELIESELFGHEKGSFTGAHHHRRGAFEEAIGGTLFLDEVGELPLDLQAKLLRALELKEIRRVGSSKPIEVDVRIVAATNRNLQQEVEAGRFREDLFYRLFVVPLTLPPLRQRPEDIELLARYFLLKAAPVAPAPELSAGALALLHGHPWPGNVRELKNTLERALLLREGVDIEPGDITFAAASSPTLAPDAISVTNKTLAEIEREAIRVVLEAMGGNRRKTAKVLGMARSTLQVRLKEMGLVGIEGED